MQCSHEGSQHIILAKRIVCAALRGSRADKDGSREQCTRIEAKTRRYVPAHGQSKTMATVISGATTGGHDLARQDARWLASNDRARDVSIVWCFYSNM